MIPADDPLLHEPDPQAPGRVADLHPIVRAAAQGELPPWTQAGKKRRKHMARVAGLLTVWGESLNLPRVHRIRWTAAGYLHDALRDARPADLRPLLPPAFRDAPGNTLHGPAAAMYLEREGVTDHDFLDAVRYHTVGHPLFRRLGLALYAADYLEPGRNLRPRFRGRLRERMPGELRDVVKEIVGARIEHLVQRETPVRPETLHLWNALVNGKPR